MRSGVGYGVRVGVGIGVSIGSEIAGLGVVVQVTETVAGKRGTELAGWVELGETGLQADSPSAATNRIKTDAVCLFIIPFLIALNNPKA